jgi:hypothetical protein
MDEEYQGSLAVDEALEAVPIDIECYGLGPLQGAFPDSPPPVRERRRREPGSQRKRGNCPHSERDLHHLALHISKPGSRSATTSSVSIVYKGWPGNNRDITRR